MQKRGVPTVTVVTSQFESLAKSAARSLGYPDLPMVVVPHPFETLPDDEILRTAEQKLPELIEKVTKPVARPMPA